MIQNCQVYINIECWNEDKPTIVNYLKDYFKDKKNLRIYGQPIIDVDIADDAEQLIVLDIEVDVQCMYIGGSRGNRWDPGEPPYIIDYLDEKDFADWAEDLFLKAPSPIKNFDIGIEIDKGSFIPTEEELIKEFEEEAEREKWYSRYAKY